MGTSEAVNRRTHTFKVFFYYYYCSKIERLRYWPVEFSCRTQTRKINVKVATVFMFWGVIGSSRVAPLHHHCLQSRRYIHVLWSSWKQPFSLASAKLSTEKIVSAFNLEEKKESSTKKRNKNQPMYWALRNIQVTTLAEDTCSEQTMNHSRTVLRVLLKIQVRSTSCRDHWALGTSRNFAQHSYERFVFCPERNV